MGFLGHREGGDDGGGAESLNGNKVGLNWRGEMEKNEGQRVIPELGSSLSKGGENIR